MQPEALKKLATITVGQFQWSFKALSNGGDYQGLEESRCDSWHQGKQERGFRKLQASQPPQLR